MENAQQKVRNIPIFVEGRDEPVINKGHDTQSTANANPPQPNLSHNTSAFASAESSSGPHHQSHHSFGRPHMNFGNDMGFGQDMPMHGGSIFDRAKDFPVRDFFNMRSASPRRSESPSYVHQQPSRSSPGPQQWQSTPQNNLDRQVPVHHTEQRQVPVQHTEQRQVPVQHQDLRQVPVQQEPMQQQVPQQAPPPEQSVPAKQKAIEDSITKIQKIQASVLDLMSRVEQFDGRDRKEYAFLDEMLTQNLLKLDDIDAEGKENIKNARREAIKCINSLISLLEAKHDEASKVGEEKTESEAMSVEPAQPTQNGVNGASKNSSYDNVTDIKQTASSNSVPTSEAPTNPESSLEAKVQEALQKQEEEAQAMDVQQSQPQ